jgi:hypothetical protein
MWELCGSSWEANEVIVSLRKGDQVSQVHLGNKAIYWELPSGTVHGSKELKEKFRSMDLIPPENLMFPAGRDGDVIWTPDAIEDWVMENVVPLLPA